MRREEAGTMTQRPVLRSSRNPRDLGVMVTDAAAVGVVRAQRVEVAVGAAVYNHRINHNLI